MKIQHPNLHSILSQTWIVFLFCMLLSFSCWANDPYATVRFKNITIEQGISNNEVKDILQDKEGFIWLATGAGLDRFDGYGVQHFTPRLKDSYKIEHLKRRPISVCIDGKGRYYLGSDYFGLQVYDPKKDSIWHYEEKRLD